MKNTRKFKKTQETLRKTYIYNIRKRKNNYEDIRTYIKNIRKINKKK